MPSTTSNWGKEIATEQVGGVPYRMYIQRPQRVEELVSFAAGWGDRPHLVQGDVTVRFAQMHAAVQAKARVLAQQGLRRGDRVFLLGWNSPQWVANFWACLQAGAVPVLANGWWSEAEVRNGLDLSQPAFVLADAHAMARMPSEVPVPGRWRSVAWAVDWSAAASLDASLPGGASEADAALITSPRVPPAVRRPWCSRTVRSWPGCR